MGQSLVSGLSGDTGNTDPNPEGLVANRSYTAQAF